MLKYNKVRTIELEDWDNLVRETYGKPYSFQQQDGCMNRGTYELCVPSKEDNDKYMNDSIPEKVNGEEMGVKFSVWLARDPKQPLNNKEEYRKEQWMIDLFWERNFYPCIETLANDLYKKGLIEAGEYKIIIDW